MVVIGGSIFVLVAVLTGFSMAGGHVGALMHPSEIVTIGGASFGALLIMAPKKVLTDLFKGILQLCKGTPYGKATVLELCGLLYALTRLVRRSGALAVDSHMSKPHESEIFQKYPKILHNHHVMDFLITGLGAVVENKTDTKALNEAFEEEIAVMKREHHQAVAALTKVADALPGFGIVAAVLGIVVTMQCIDGPASEIGHKVGAALVGTFLGILMSYGFLAPLAGRMEVFGEIEEVFMRAIVVGINAMVTGESPKDVVIRVRRVVGTEHRPTQDEMTAIFKDTSNG